MATTNKQIIFFESVDLMKAGKLSGTGEFLEMENGNGEKIRYEIPEQIHTFARWKELGYSVKKGEHAIAAFSIWKYATKGKKSEQKEEDTQESGHCFMKKAFWFSAAQVEPLKARS